MAELKIYSGKDESDDARTEALKRFSKEAPAGPAGARDHEEAVMERASTEVKRRAEKTMLYANVSYHEAATRVLRADGVLARLYAFGYIEE